MKMNFNANTMRDEDAISLVEQYLNDTYGIDAYGASVFVVWKCKTIQNVKFIVGTSYNNNFFELTLNGDTNELYIDVYRKIDKVTIFNK